MLQSCSVAIVYRIFSSKNKPATSTVALSSKRNVLTHCQCFLRPQALTCICISSIVRVNSHVYLIAGSLYPLQYVSDNLVPWYIFLNIKICKVYADIPEHKSFPGHSGCRSHTHWHSHPRWLLFSAFVWWRLGGQTTCNCKCCTCSPLMLCTAIHTKDNLLYQTLH